MTCASGNTVSGTTAQGILANNGTVSVSGNTVYNTGDDGIEVNSSAGVLVQNNLVGMLGGAANIGGEGIDVNNSDGAQVTGNTVIDALLEVVARLDGDHSLRAGFEGQFDYLDPNRRLILVTGHRRESFGGGFERICQALVEIARRFPDSQVLYPVHLNPNVREPVQRLLRNIDNIRLIEPLDYLPFVYLMNRAHIILTDSGGIQEEAPSLGKPVLVMRETTERPEALDAGTVRLVGTDSGLIVQEVERLLNNEAAYKDMAYAHNPYGDGKACDRIVEILSHREW